MGRSSASCQRALFRFAVFLAVAAALGERPASAQAVEFDSRATIFHEPAKGSTMTVYTPSADLTARPWDFLSVSAGWEADIVSGASERLKAGPLARNPDVVSAASSISDTRQIGRGSIAVKREA